MNDWLDRVLPTVSKPARYTGGEWNSIVKDWDACDVRWALVFPDVYDIGMSNLGLAILYDVLNRLPGVLAERACAPWIDMEQALRATGPRLPPACGVAGEAGLQRGPSLPPACGVAGEAGLQRGPFLPPACGVAGEAGLQRGPFLPPACGGAGGGQPLFSLESRRPLAQFDVIGVSLPYEQLYTNLLNLLDLSGLPLLAAERSGRHPLLIAGGSAVFNPEPIADFVDAFVLGEGEEAVVEITDAVRETRQAGLRGRTSEVLRRLAAIPGVYVPSFYQVAYHPDGTLAEVRPTLPEAQFPVRKRIVARLPPPITRPLVPYVDTVHNRAAVEIQRGCGRGCRFCLAGMVYRPVRERPLPEVLDAVDSILSHTGFEEIALLSLSSSDYTHIEVLVRELVARHGHEHLSVSLPSLRIESVSVALMDQLQATGRRTTFTFAPEAGTERLRRVINKPVADDDLLAVTGEVFGRGWKTVKLYFMIGHPTQTLDDVAAIADLAIRVRDVGRRALGRKAQVHVGVSTLVPKPHTPFQWVPLAAEVDVRAQQEYLIEHLHGPGLKLNWSNYQETLLEATLSRGDRRLGPVIARAWQLGARFDAWSDQFRPDAWRRAFHEAGTDPAFYALRSRPAHELLPWDHLDAGVSKSYLLRDYLASLRGDTHPDCREQCYACGILSAFRAEHAGLAEGVWVCPPETAGGR